MMLFLKEWEEARIFLVERLKQISNAVNDREIGFFLDEELLSGKAFIPGVTISGNNPGTFRQIFRIVVTVGQITAGVNAIAHGIAFNGNFTLIQLWASGTNSSTLKATTFGNSDTIRMDATNIYITSDGTYDRCYAIVEYLLEL